jgi:hypothetical protein
MTIGEIGYSWGPDLSKAKKAESRVWLNPDCPATSSSAAGTTPDRGQA